MARRQRDAADADESLGGDGMTALEGTQTERQPVPRGEAEGDRDLDSLMAELGDEVEWVVLRRYENSDWVTLAKIDAAEANIEALKAKWGGGKYRARVIYQDGTYGKMVTFRLAGKPKNPDDEDDDHSKNELLERIASLEKQLTTKTESPDNARDRLLEAVITRVMTPPSTPQRDPLIDTLITALINGRPSSAGFDPIELQKLLSDARKEGMELGERLGEASADAGEQTVETILAKELPKLTEIVVNAQGRPNTSNRRRVTAPNPVAQTATQTTTQPVQEIETVPDNPIAKYLSPVIPVILKWARSGKTPDVKAVNMIDDLTDAQKDTIGQMAEGDDFVATVMAAVPAFNAPDVKEWVESFLKTVQDTLAPTEDEDAAPETTAEPVTENGGETTEA